MAEITAAPDLRLSVRARVGNRMLVGESLSTGILIVPCPVREPHPCRGSNAILIGKPSELVALSADLLLRLDAIGVLGGALQEFARRKAAGA